MTRDEITALSPRELDALIAEKVEGLPVVWAPDPFRVPDRRLSGRFPWLKSSVNGLDYDWSPVKRYATDWSIMRRVIEAMHERGWSCQLRSYLSDNSRDNGSAYHARFTPNNCPVRGGESEFEMPGEEAPLAIARAALWAIEESARLEREFAAEQTAITEAET